MDQKIRAGIIGATGMVGQRFVTLLADHPWFDIQLLAASPRSAGKVYGELMEGHWMMKEALPAKVAGMVVQDASHVQEIAAQVDMVFCAVNMDKQATRELEEAYAKAGLPVVSNNSANRLVSDVPMVIPEINPEHLEVIEAQRRRLGTDTGFIVVKPNCSIQSYVPPLTPLRKFGITKVLACTYQAISGAGKTFETFPNILDNVIPYIGGEEEKSEKEPLKVWGKVEDGQIKNTDDVQITSQCLRVPVSDGHTAAVFVSFATKPTKEEILEAWRGFRTRPQELGLPSAPDPFLVYFEEDDRPQPRLDRDLGGGMAVSMGRLRPDSQYDYKFIGLSHNTLRGAAGGGLETAELLVAEGYIKPRKG
ncbi:MAG: aspartate-semialdehyde dehydrogenase [Eubacteriales bacterium]|nr:aspartate-semialdehyde dehydrogenase [Eubacteriales bacterium]